MISSILVFFAVIFLLGHGTILAATGRMRHNIETLVMSTGVGLGAFAVATLLLNTLGIPLAWWSFLAAGFALEALGLLRCALARKPAANGGRPERFCTRDDIFLAIAAGLAVILFAVFLHGEFSAAWLPDDDSWGHAATAKYVAIHRTYTISREDRTLPVTDLEPHGIVSYLEPYPPAYPVLMGVMNQLNTSMCWTLKFFNVLLIGLGILWFYPAAREFLGGNSKLETRNSNPAASPSGGALPSSFEFRVSPQGPEGLSGRGASFRAGAAALWMTGVLAVLPCFMSHFIWAQTLALVLFFPAFYALERARREPAWAIVAAVAVGAIALSQPSAAAVFGMMALLYWLVNVGFAALSRGRLFAPRALVRQAAAAAAGLLIAAAFYVPEYVKFGYNDFMFGIGKIPPEAVKGGRLPEITGTGLGQTYGLWDFAWAPAFRNKINQPTGIGLALFVALAAGVVLLLARPRRLKENRWAVVALLWLAFTALGVEGRPVALFPHRFWVFLAIPVAMIAGEFFAWLASALDWKSAATAVALALAIGGIVVFSGVAERLCLAVEDIPGAPPWSAPAGAPLGLLLLSVLLAPAALALLIYRLTRPSDAPESPGTRALALAGALVLPVLIAGTVVTSGYGKALLQGFIDWQPGVRFYVGTTLTADGRRVAVQQHLRDYLFIHDNFPHDSPILIVNGPDDYLTGFDMFALPYDRDIRLMRAEVLSAAPGDLDARTLGRIIDLARRKKFDYLLVDHYWAAEHQYYAGTNQGSIQALARAAGLSERRFSDLFFGGAQPAEEEKPWVERIRPALERLRLYQEKESREVERARRLRDLMRRSSALVPILDREPFAVAVFRIKTTP